MRKGRGTFGLVLAVGLLAATIPATGQGTADFPGATWSPALYYTPGRSGYNVQYIVIHATDGERTSGTVRDYGEVKAVGDQASAHYIIGNGVGYPDHEAYAEGQVIQMVHDADTAYGIAVWPAGTPDAKHSGAIHNYNSISIELAGLPNVSGWCPEKMYESAAKLIVFLVHKYAIPATRTRILGHDEVGQTCVPPITSRFDPCGASPGRCTFDWDHLMSLVTRDLTAAAEPVATICYCIEQGGFDYCGTLAYGYSHQWLQNGAANTILLANARRAKTLEPVGPLDFDRIEIHVRTWACYEDAWAKLTTDNVSLVVDKTAQVIALDDMEGQVFERWIKLGHITGGEIRGGSALAVVSPDDRSQALQVYVPSGIDSSCAGVWAIRAFDMPHTVNTSDVTLRLFVLAEGQGQYHEGFIQIFLYKGS
jgi:N-acetyl-anhydromuramyl-L-alanine amidase AmpD